MRQVPDELELLAELVPLPSAKVIELGCGAAALARELVRRHAGAKVAALEVDERQHAKNLASPAEGIEFVSAGAQAIPFADENFDLALMLKSLHHVPSALMATALAEVARVLRPGAWLYVSEPVYGGPLNDLIRLFNDEREVRAAAQAALDAAIASGRFLQRRELWFESPVHFADFDTFERRMMRPTFADHQIDDDLLERVRRAFSAHCNACGAQFVRPMRVRLLQRRPA